MTYDLYIDVLFVINFVMDFLVLSMTGRLMKYPKKVCRLICASAAGALWAGAAVILEIPFLLEIILTYAAVPAVMTAIAFRLKKGKEIGKTVLCLYLVTVMAAGIMEALYQHTRAGYYIEQMLRGDSRGTMSLCRLLLLAGGAWFGLRYALQAFSEIRNQTKYYYEVTIHYRGKVKTITALLDTGNRLYEPVTRRPVHVVTYEAVRDICESVSSVIYIPFGSVGKKNGVLPGIFLDEMEVRQGDEVKIIKKPLVAVCREPLSADGQYQMLLHED